MNDNSFLSIVECYDKKNKLPKASPTELKPEELKKLTGINLLGKGIKKKKIYKDI